ncbi:MAG: aa3-type cytochrome c oxidase subunit IV [Rhizobiaceae bacterium]
MADVTYEIDDHGAPMDYPEHEQTYSKFLWLAKWGVLANVAFLIAMAAGFFLGAGLFGGIAVFIVLMVIAKFLA